MPYSDNLLRLVTKMRSTVNPEEKANLMLTLASLFLSEHDFADEDITDDYHAYFEEYQAARLRFQQAAFRVARLALQEIQSYQNETTDPVNKVN
jgi:hypothetical protein